jgi:hypothetical protein
MFRGFTFGWRLSSIVVGGGGRFGRLPVVKRKTLPAQDFKKLMRDAGYEMAGARQGQAGRVKVWWSH